MQKAGELAFIIGVAIALILGLASKWVPANWVPFLGGLLVLMGLVVGALNVTHHETKDFLLVGAVLILAATGAGTLTALGTVGEMMKQTFSFLLIFIVPSMLVVCLKAVYGMSKDA